MLNHCKHCIDIVRNLSLTSYSSNNFPAAAPGMWTKALF